MATNRKFIGEQTPGPREAPSKSMKGNPRFIGENTVGSVNRLNPDRAFLSNKVTAGLVPVDAPNGVVSFDDGMMAPDMLIQGSGGSGGTGGLPLDGTSGKFIQGRPSAYYGNASRRKLFGGNRSGE